MMKRNLEIEEDFVYQQRSWRFERAGWIAMGLVIAAALVGLFGKGPLAWGVAGDPLGPIWIQYERFSRYETAAPLYVHANAGAARDGRLRIEFDHQYLSFVRIESIVPEPEISEASPRGMRYVVRCASPDQPTVVIFNMKSQYVGFLTAHIHVEDTVTLSFRQFVYP
jgi:hypothetical protein